MLVSSINAANYRGMTGVPEVASANTRVLTGSLMHCVHVDTVLDAAQLPTGHYILELEELHRPRRNAVPLQVHQPLTQLMMDLGPPLFKLTGLAIGNGLTDPQLQVSNAECNTHCYIVVA